VRGLLCLVLMVVFASGSHGEMRRIHLPTTALVADATRGRLYVATPGTAGSIGNRVVTILPDSLTVVSSPLGAFVGSEPAVLAIDDQATVLYVGLRGAPMVTRIRLDTFARDLAFGLGSDPFFGPLYAGDLAVMPGNPQTVAVVLASLNVSPESQGVAIYDDGTSRPDVVRAFAASDSITFGLDPTRLYGLNNETSDFGFRRMSVGPTGVTTIDVTDGLAGGFGADIEFDGEHIVTAAGTAIEPEGPSGPTLLGTYSIKTDSGSTVPASGPVASDPAQNRVYYVSQPFDASTPSLLTYDRSTFALLDELPLPQVDGTAYALVRWGSDGLAFATTTGDVFLMASSFSPCTDGTQCDDGDACTTDSCNEGTCIHTAVSCSDQECASERCDPASGCVPSSDEFGQACTDDGDPCTVDRCGSTGCEHSLEFGLQCTDDGDPCTEDTCDTGGCQHRPISGVACADDGNPCTKDVCAQTGCTHEAMSADTSCADDGDACTQDLCDASGNCGHQGYSSEDPGYYSCTVDNIAAALLPDPPCTGRCGERLRMRASALDTATTDAFYSSTLPNDCRGSIHRALAQAIRLASTVRSAKHHRLLSPKSRAVELVHLCNQAVTRLRPAARRFCPTTAFGVAADGPPRP
jgi:Dictyostelium (slime mold) repeat